MKYVWKVDEVGWAMAVAGIIFIFELLSRFEVEALTDWRAYVIAAVAGLVRAVFGAGLALMRKPGGGERQPLFPGPTAQGKK